MKRRSSSSSILKPVLINSKYITNLILTYLGLSFQYYFHFKTSLQLSPLLNSWFFFLYFSLSYTTHHSVSMSAFMTVCIVLFKLFNRNLGCTVNKICISIYCNAEQPFQQTYLKKTPREEQSDIYFHI